MARKVPSHSLQQRLMESRKEGGPREGPITASLTPMFATYYIVFPEPPAGFHLVEIGVAIVSS